jgi:putative membrane protein
MSRDRDEKRFPPHVYGAGEDPDARFSLANERTFLAWTRTSLALFATGVALEALDVPINPALRLVAATLFVALGLVSVVQGWFGWARTEKALRLGRALPGPMIGPVLSVGIAIGIVLIGAGLLW